MVRVLIVYDNTSADSRCEPDHGFACVVDAHGQRVLFDTGASGDRLLHNMDSLGVAPVSVGRVVISHAHRDHIGGLAAFLGQAQVPVYLPASAEGPTGIASLRRVSGPARIADGLHTTGQMPALEYPLQEQSLVIDTPAGSVVVVGCAHPGVDEILRVAGTSGRVRALIGGLHGFRDLAALSDIECVCPAHCTQHGDEIGRAWPFKVTPGGVGRVLEFA